MPTFTLAQHGDFEERAAWPLFLAAEFPQYEEFWCLFVVELTGRVKDVRDIGFRSEVELDDAGRPGWHVEVAQLHYTTLLHLRRVFDLRRSRVRDRDSFFEAIVRLDAATDTAFELLGHCLIDRGKSKGWDENVGKRVRQAWDTKEKRPLKLLQDYRNSLLHGRVRPEHELRIRMEDEDWQTMVPLYPTFEKMSKALDWRKASSEDAEPADHLVDKAWNDVLGYLRTTWDAQLLPWARALFTPSDVPTDPTTMRLQVDGARALSADAPPEYHGGSIVYSPTRAVIRREEP